MRLKIPISQKDELGCAVACLAFLTNKSYQEVIDELNRPVVIKRGVYCKEITSYLNKLGYKANYHYLNSKWRNKIYKHKTMVFIKRDRRYIFGHFLIRYKNMWIDPWINFQKDKNVKNSEAGFRKRLPGKPIYAVFIDSEKKQKE